MEIIKMGTKAKSAAILRSVLADGCKGRAILLSKDPAVKQIAFDNKIRRAVEVTQNDCIRLRLSPRATYYLLIARLNTDLKGVVHGSEFVIEYLQLSESVYNEFVEQVEEMGKFTSIVLNKVSKGEYSYIKVSPSNQYQVTDELKEKIRELRKNTELISAMWQMVDISTSITVAEYEKLLAESPETAQAQIAQPKTTRRMISAPVQTQEFDEGDEFDDHAQDVESAPVDTEVPVPEAPAHDVSADEYAGITDGDFDDFGDFN